MVMNSVILWKMTRNSSASLRSFQNSDRSHCPSLIHSVMNEQMEAVQSVSVDQWPAHVVLFPFLLEGHIKPFMNLAKFLSARGFYITFVLFKSIGDNAHIHFHILMQKLQNLPIVPPVTFKGHPATNQAGGHLSIFKSCCITCVHSGR